MIACGYIRVSTEGQVEDGVSLDAQAEKIRAYCQLHGLELIEIFADEGLSGKRSDNRPGLHRALDTVCKMGGVLVVFSLSRLARSTMDCIQIADRLSKCGAELASLSERIDTSSSMGKFFYSLLAALAQLERDQIAERTTVAMSHLRRQGRRISRAIPFGFDLADDGKTLLPNAAELAVIDQIKACDRRWWKLHLGCGATQRPGHQTEVRATVVSHLDQVGAHGGPTPRRLSAASLYPRTTAISNPPDRWSRIRGSLSAGAVPLASCQHQPHAAAGRPEHTQFKKDPGGVSCCSEVEFAYPLRAGVDMHFPVGSDRPLVAGRGGRCW